MIELRKKGVAMPPKVVDDFRTAKLMIKIAESPESEGGMSRKLEECLGGLESYLIGAAEKTMPPEIVDKWLSRIDEAALSKCERNLVFENKFITGVPRDQNWIRVEPMPNLRTDRLQEIAKDSNLSINTQKDGRAVVYGKQNDIKTFLKRIAEEASGK